MKKPTNEAASVRIFQAFGKDEISRMESYLNDFLGQQIQIISVSPQMCSVGDLGGEIYQAMTITVLYRGISPLS